MSDPRDRLKSNSLRIRTNGDIAKPEHDKPKVELKGGVKKQKRTVWQRINEEIKGDDSRSVGEYLLCDVLIPAAKDTIVEMVKSGVDMMIYGEVRKTSRSTSSTTGSRIDYGSFSSGRSSNLHRDRRDRSGYEPLIFDTKADGEEVLDRLCMILEDYEMVSLADLYELVDEPTTHPDRKWGWYKLNQAAVIRVRDGWMLDLPNPRVLD